MPECDWCHRALAPRARQRFCSQRCRQSAWRFSRHQGPAPVRSTSATARIAYADPPYPGLSALYYKDHPDFAGEVDHEALADQLEAFDGWALSTSAAALWSVLRCFKRPVGVACWARGVRQVKSYRAQVAWEPVIYRPARAILREASEGVPDFLDFAARARRSDPDRVTGAKPAAFAFWLFGLLGAQPGDDFHDLFPGSNGMRRAWDLYSAGADQCELALGDDHDRTDHP